MDVKLTTPGSILEANAGFHREISLTEIEGQTIEEELCWAVDSQLEVGLLTLQGVCPLFLLLYSNVIVSKLDKLSRTNSPTFLINHFWFVECSLRIIVDVNSECHIECTALTLVDIILVLLLCAFVV